MDLHQLYIFTKVVEHKSFSKAAEEIFLSQSTVSSHIQSLEKSLNVTLFDRIGREVIVTPQGQRLYYWAQKLLRLKDEAILDLNKSSHELEGIIRIGASSVPSQFIVPKIIRDFSQNYNNVTFSLFQSASKVIAKQVHEGNFDIGIIGEKYMDERLEYVPLLKDRLSLIWAPNYFSFQEPITFKQLIENPLVMRQENSGTKAMIDRFLKRKGIREEELNIIAYTDSNQSLVELVKQGIGISLISELAAKECAKFHDLSVHPITDFTDKRYFYLIYNKKRTLSMITQLFIEMTRSKFQIHDSSD